MNSSPARVANNMHKHLYKSPGGFAHGINQNNVESPTWRDAYKKKCFEEFKKSRQKLITKFRKCQVRSIKYTFKSFKFMSIYIEIIIA